MRASPIPVPNAENQATGQQHGVPDFSQYRQWHSNVLQTINHSITLQSMPSIAERMKTLTYQDTRWSTDVFLKNAIILKAVLVKMPCNRLEPCRRCCCLCALRGIEHGESRESVPPEEHERTHIEQMNNNTVVPCQH